VNEAELLFTEILNCDRLSLYLNKNLILDKGKSDLVCSVLKKRICGEPLHYILGKIEFMGLEFKVTPDVLIPRPETEILVETAINLVRSLDLPVTKTRVLDMGTGSGCIAVSLAKILPGIKIWAVDISNRALKVAKSNAKRHGVKADFLKSDLFNSPALETAAYDIILANPPYIASAEIDKLSRDLKYEPAIALDGGGDGLDFYRRLVPASSLYLREGGFLMMEMGFNQAEPIKNIFLNSFDLKIIEIIKDYNGIERVLVAKKEKEAIWIN
jgi:release factor glutamine methyltransferase